MRRPFPILCLCVAVLLATQTAQARSARARIAKITTPVATLQQVRLQLDWADGAPGGRLEIRAGRVDAPALGYHFRDLRWSCPLQRAANDGWQCAGELRAGNAAPWLLALQLDPAITRATLGRGQSRLALVRSAATPDLTTLDLAAVPLQWAQALLAQAWSDARLKSGTLDGRLAITAPARAPLRIDGQLQATGVGLENADSSIVGEGLGGRFDLHYLAATTARVNISGSLRKGELLVGSTYVALPDSPVQLTIDAEDHGAAGWTLPRIAWTDGKVLTGGGSARLAPDGSLQDLEVQAHSDDIGPLRPRYLSGWLALFGLGEVELQGGLDLRTRMRNGQLAEVDAELRDVRVHDPAGRFGFDGLRGTLRYSDAARVDSALQWDGGDLYGLQFGPAQLPFTSAGGVLRGREDWVVPMFGGTLRLQQVAIRPPQGASGTDIRFGLQLAGIDFGKVSQALGLPAFKGVLGGEIPLAHYANDRIDFDGGLALHLFEGRVKFTSLALERPFGTAPSLTADISLDDLDLERLTEVLGFGSITGRLDGTISAVRLVDWTPAAFDARFITDPRPGVPQRISQRAVQDISSVGDSSFMASLQGRLIAIFSDFGYRRIGIGCRLENQICTMSGLPRSGSAQGGNAFTIVEGGGMPRLDVIGFNRAVDWPTLVERLVAAGKGEVAPVIE